jgi:hypothetical protein
MLFGLGARDDGGEHGARCLVAGSAGFAPQEPISIPGG